MANPRAFKVRLRAAGAGVARSSVRGGIDAASVARSGAWGGWRDARLPVWLGLRLDPSGKRAPVCGQILGHAFRMGCAAETASQNIDSERDTVSRSTLKRKPHPALMRGLRTKAEP